MDEQDIVMNSVEMVNEIIKYSASQGVDFETACRMLLMIYNDGVHLESDCE